LVEKSLRILTTILRSHLQSWSLLNNSGVLRGAGRSGLLMLTRSNDP